MPSSKSVRRKSSGPAPRRRAVAAPAPSPAPRAGANPDASPFTLRDRPPTPEEFGELIEAVGWTRFTNLEALPAAIDGSLFWVVAEHAGRVVGMGRLVGDGARFVYVQDLMVLPGFQRRGIGSAILDRLLDYVNLRMPRKVHVHLFTDERTAGFYRRYGFKGPEGSFYGMSVKKFGKPLGRGVRIG
jgi:GNAT superfamily N-acetyltransferase